MNVTLYPKIMASCGNLTFAGYLNKVVTMKYVLGIDQGGTKTAAIVCNTDGKIIGTGMDAGLADVYFADTEELYIKRITNAASKACEMAGISIESIACACGGLNGADWDFEYPILTERLSRALTVEKTIVLNDCIAAMRGGSAKKECAVVCAGTGLNAAVQHSNGQQIIYGYYIDNAHQGGGALGAAALRKIMESHLGICGKTSLTDAILRVTGHKTPEHLLIALTTGGFHLDRKTLAPLLLKAYACGDAEATTIVESFAYDLAQYITAGMRRLSISGSNTDIVFSGSVFKDVGTLVANRVFENILLQEPNVQKVHAKYEPVCGAALTALESLLPANINLSEEATAAFDETAKTHGLHRNLKVQ